jgi:O-antigen ligase
MSWISARWRYLLTIVLLFTGLTYACIEGSYNWRGRLDVQLFGLAVFGGGLLVWLGVRGLARKSGLPKTGLGWVFGLGLVCVALSFAGSADPRQSLWRVSWLAGYVLLFYVLVDGLDSGCLDRRAAPPALLLVSGAAVALALLETYAWYLGWFAAVGSGEWPPFQYRFGSIFGYSNVLMSLANLGAPLALMVFLRGKSRPGRVGAALWLLLYLAAIPFSSSRGGWIGLAGWVGTLVLIGLVEKRPWRWVLGWRRLYQLLAAGALLIGLAGAAFIGLRFWLAFSAHPSHGGDPFGGRSYLWAYAIQMWQRSPVFGIGPGRYSLEHPLVNPHVPPAFWSYNAHGMPVEVLTEFGVLGALVLLILLAVGGWVLWKRVRAAQAGRAPYALALFAGLAGWLCQMVVDDFTSWIAIMVPLALMAAWIVTAPEAPLARYGAALDGAGPRRIFLTVNWLWIPALALLAYAGWDLWGYAPTWAGLQAANRGDWPAAAAAMQVSAQRDPALNLYSTESAIAEAWAWQQSGDPADLARARDWLARSLAREPQLSPLRANLAALDWQAGERGRAEEEMRQAQSQSPDEPSYPLNLGYYLEANGRADEALLAYRRALDLSPAWQTHLFWQTSSLRAQALSGWTPAAASTPGVDTVGFEAALAAGNFQAASRLAAIAGMQGDTTLLQARLSEARGDLPAAFALYRGVRDLAAEPILRRGSNFSFAYTLWGYNRPGLIVDRVPGYLNLDGDAAFFAAMEHLHALEVQRGECEQAARTWTVWQQALRGFALEEIPSAPVCP